MAAKKKSAGATVGTGETPIEALTHKDTRKNIPTREQGEFVADEEQAPETMLYPRDPTLDPQLVWKGKDQQDRQDLAVPIVPIYIQETIKPKALIDDLRGRTQGSKPQLDLFGDVTTKRDFEEEIEFYEHENKWTNRMILGDSLVVMTSLGQKEGLKGSVQMVYLDPPYGIKFGSNWQVSTRKRDVKDGKIEDLVRQPEQVKAFRDTWEVGIHSYLSYLRDRIQASRDLLTESGSIFVQIGDDNVHLVRALLDEVFGPENFCSQISFRTKIPLGTKLLAGIADYIIWYAKSLPNVKYRKVFEDRRAGEDSQFSYVETSAGIRRRMTAEEARAPEQMEAGNRAYRLTDMVSAGRTESCVFDFSFQGSQFGPSGGKSWKTNPGGVERLIKAGRISASGRMPAYVFFHDDYPVQELSNLWVDTQGASDKLYAVQTAEKPIQRCMVMTTDPGDLVLDPTCGAGTTAFLAEMWGRRWITIDTSRVAMALARTRITSAKFPYYILTDSDEGRRKIAGMTADSVPAGSGPAGNDVRAGFVYHSVPHVTLGSIANNFDIDLVHARFVPGLDALRLKMNSLLKKAWHEWQVPVEADPSWSSDVRRVHADWLSQRQLRRREIDQVIARGAESEVRYDQPYEDPKRVRVAGPFTVESLSPHRVLASNTPQPASEASGSNAVSSFVTTILDNLKKAGVQNTIKGERLTFDRLNPFAGRWIQAEAEYTDKAGITRRAAVSLGPEHGTVSPEQVRGAAKEATKHFDLVIVCGFAFDALAYEAAKEFSPKGSMPPSIKPGATAATPAVLLSRMNPDLAMGDELLKKTGAGNLFMVFGEPDITLTKQKDGKFVIEIKGLDVYDPTTGAIRSHTTDDIACWFLDTDYNGECFFVRHAYFTGAQDPYEKLKRALKAEIDEEAWASLYSTVSRPFEAPKSGLIAVKVINHYGDEVLKLYEVK